MRRQRSLAAFAGEWVALGSSDRVYEVWRLPPYDREAGTFEAKRILQKGGDAGFLFETRFAPDGETIALSGLDGLVEMVDVTIGEMRLEFQPPGGVRDVVFTPDGRRVLTRTLAGNVRMFTLDRDELIALGRARVSRGLTEAECQKFLHMDSCPE